MACHAEISATTTSDFHIEPGTLDDYRALAASHYRSHHPGAATSVLRITHRASTDVGRHLRRVLTKARDLRLQDETTLVGVLVRSLPALNCTLRDRALSNRYASLDPRERGIVINREVRCISRVIIEPRFRGMGLAVQLVRHALDHPEVDSLLYTEALAAMGRVSPFFERAGMTRFEHVDSTRAAHERFEAALRTAGEDQNMHALLVREAKRFLRTTRRISTDRFSTMADEQIVAEARKRLSLQPVYFIFAHCTN